MSQWSLTQASFDQFLDVLDSDRDKAGHKYRDLRTRIVKFFEWRASRDADDLADKALDRVMRKIDAGQEITDPVKYAYGVSRLVYLESVRKQVVEEETVGRLPGPDTGDDRDDRPMDCLETCLNELPPNSREMILGYYAEEKQSKIDYRKHLADRFRISVNALRIKTLRIRTALESCVSRCLDAGG